MGKQKPVKLIVDLKCVTGQDCFLFKGQEVLPSHPEFDTFCERSVLRKKDEKNPKAHFVAVYAQEPKKEEPKKAAPKKAAPKKAAPKKEDKKEDKE